MVIDVIGGYRWVLFVASDVVGGSVAVQSSSIVSRWIIVGSCSRGYRFGGSIVGGSVVDRSEGEEKWCWFSSAGTVDQ